MSYIGTTPEGLLNRDGLDYQIFDGGLASYTLARAVGNAASLMIFAGGVHQKPDVDYSVNGTTLTPLGGLWNVGTGNVLVFYVGVPNVVNVPAVGSVNGASFGFLPGDRIRGDFSNATVANRVMFQTSTVNGNTIVGAIANGTGTNSQFTAFAGSDPTNTSTTVMQTEPSTGSNFIAGQTGSGGFLPMRFVTGGAERMRIDTSGNISIPTLGARITGDFSNATVANRLMFQTSTVNGNTSLGAIPNGSGQATALGLFTSSSGGSAAITLRGGADTQDARIAAGTDSTGVTQYPMTFWTSGAERVRIATGGQVGIAGSPNGNAGLQVYQTSNPYGFEVFAATGGTNSGKASIRLINAGNTIERLLLEGESDTISRIAAASSLALVTNNTERLRIDVNGNVLVTNNTGGLGYGTGAGGTVTQGSSSGKSTTVTLNRPCGQITMNNAALGAGATVFFQLSNSLLSAFDNLIVSKVWDSISNANYRVETAGVGVGAAQIRVTNISGGSLSDAVVLNFAIIIGAPA